MNSHLRAAVGLLFLLSIVMGLTTPAEPSELNISAQAKAICGELVMLDAIPIGKDNVNYDQILMLLVDAHSQPAETRASVQMCLDIHHVWINLLDQGELVSLMADVIKVGNIGVANLAFPKWILEKEWRMILDAAYKE